MLLNVAVTVLLTSIVTVHTFVDEVHPVQLANVYPGFAVAVSSTAVFVVNDVEVVARPSTFLVMEPLVEERVRVEGVGSLESIIITMTMKYRLSSSTFLHNQNCL